MDVIGHSLDGMFAAELAAVGIHLVRAGWSLVSPTDCGSTRRPCPTPSCWRLADVLAQAKWS